MKTWLKGGIISIILILLLYISIMIFGGARDICEFNTQENISCTNVQVFQTFFLPVHSTTFTIGTLIIFSIVFAIGALIGLAISKIRSKK